LRLSEKTAEQNVEDPGLGRNRVGECGRKKCEKDANAARGLPALIQFEHCSAPLLP
jgi:hypothetical protein